MTYGRIVMLAIGLLILLLLPLLFVTGCTPLLALP